MTAPLVPTDAAAVTVMHWRGRPSKPKDPEDSNGAPTVTPVVTAGANASPVNCGCGRSPKLKEPITEAISWSTIGMLCLLGSLPKKAKVAEEALIRAPAAAAGVAADARAILPVKRGRGRSPKVREISQCDRSTFA